MYLFTLAQADSRFALADLRILFQIFVILCHTELFGTASNVTRQSQSAILTYVCPKAL